MAKKIYDVVTGDEDQNGKTHWRKHGILIVKDNGGLALKLESYPVGGDGWFGVFEQKPKPPQAPAPQQAPAPVVSQEDIPF